LDAAERRFDMPFGPFSPSRFLLSAALGATMAVTTVARAEAPQNARTSSLGWVRIEGAEGCIGSRQLAESVERILGRPVFVSASDAELSVEGRVNRVASPAGWKAVLRVSDARGALIGNRELEAAGADCHALDDSVAFVVAVMIDPEAEKRPKPVSPALESRHWQLQLSVGGELVLGMLPSPAAGPMVRLRLGAPVWAAEISGTYLVPQAQEVAAIGGHADVRWSLAFVGAALCPRVVSTSAVSLVACAGVDAGSLRARGNGFLITTASTDPGVFARAGLRLEWLFARRFFAALEPRVAFPLVREEYVYADSNGTTPRLFRMPVVTGAANLAFGFALE